MALLKRGIFWLSPSSLGIAFLVTLRTLITIVQASIVIKNQPLVYLLLLGGGVDVNSFVNHESQHVLCSVPSCYFLRLSNSCNHAKIITACEA